MKETHYRHLLIMTILSFASMYVLMYAMVDSVANAYSNLNQVYMAGLMTAAMVVVELLVMRSMYHNKVRNALVIGGSAVAMIAFVMSIRAQAGVSDRQFLRSMIPHHASALLMCERASIQDPEMRRLCRTIVSGQQAEIDLMKGMLRDLE